MCECAVLCNRILQWMQYLGDQLIREGVLESAIRYLHIVWYHPQQVSQQWYHHGGSDRVWPVVLGMGPHKGLRTALLRVGVHNSKELIYRVLEVAHRWVYDAFGDPPAAAAKPHISVHWAGGINTALLVGKDDNPRERARQRTQYTYGGRWGQCAGDMRHMWRT